MEATPMKYICVMVFLLILGISGLGKAENAKPKPWGKTTGGGALGPRTGLQTARAGEGAGECGKSSADDEAMKLFPCAGPAMDPNATPSAACCAQVKRIGQNPSCLCAVMLSNTAKSSGIKPETALTIPKRCNFANRPVGYKCGPYTLP